MGNKTSKKVKKRNNFDIKTKKEQNKPSNKPSNKSYKTNNQQTNDHPSNKLNKDSNINSTGSNKKSPSVKHRIRSGAIAAQQRRDLLISGYIRQTESSLFLTIPTDIKQTISIFLTLFGDSWDTKNYNAPGQRSVLKITDNTIHLFGCTSTFERVWVLGKQVIQNGGYYEWKLKIVESMIDIHVGLALDKRKSSTSFVYGIMDGSRFCCVKNNKFSSVKHIRYGQEIGNEGDVIDMCVDLTKYNSSIRFKINNLDYGVAWDKIIKTHHNGDDVKYQLAVVIKQGGKDVKVELC